MKSTMDVARGIGCSRRIVEHLLADRPELKPKTIFGGSFVWTDQEEAALREALRRVTEEREARRSKIRDWRF